MGISIGLLELKSIPPGVLAADEMLKAANVELLLSSPICPGKHVVIISGNVGAVESAMKAGRLAADVYLVGDHVIHNVHDSIPAAVTGTADVENIKALGVVETISSLAAVRAGDVAAKASNIRLIEIRIARGLGGKGFLMYTGEVSAVSSAMKAVLAEMEDSGEITSSVVIPSPHKFLIDNLI